MTTRRGGTLAVLAGIVLGAFLSGPVVAASSSHRCARLVRRASPQSLAKELRGLPREEIRRRLVDRLKRDVADAGREVLALLGAGGQGDVVLLWGPAVVCGSAGEEVWDRVAALPEVEAVFRDPPRSSREIDDGGEGPNRAVPPEGPLVALHVPEVWDRGLTGRGVVVALIDTGVDMSHPDLADHLWVNEDEVADNGIDDDGNGYVDDVRGWDFSGDDNDPSDTSGHGTNAAGLLAGDGSSGRQTGVAPDATVMVIKRGTTQAKLWEASQYAVDNGARIISQSTSWKWSFQPDYASWRRQAEVELAAGVIHANSGGNTGESLDLEPVPYNVAAPANCPPPWHHPEQSPQNGVSSVIGVGNVDARSLEINGRSPYGPAEWTDIQAHRDPGYPYEMPPDLQDYPTWDGGPGLGKPDLVAPGEGSWTTELGGGYATFGGTSASTPRVAGFLALMLQAVPGATPAELTQALLESATDYGPPGRDSRFGAGLPDALAAVDALGPPLRVKAVELIDPGPPRGDGDGGADEGEIDRLRIEVENTSGQALDGVELILRGGPLAEVRDGFESLGTIPAHGSAATAEPHFSVEFLAGSCGRRAEVSLELRQGNAARVEPLLLGVGTEIQEDLIATEFETSAGFTESSNAADGAWVREQPVGTFQEGEPVNPGQDHTEDPGVLAWVTGNGPTDPAAADVDGGATRLTSPAVDAAVYDEVELLFHRWFYGGDGAGEDRYTVEATGDGTTWTMIEEITATENSWRRRRITLSDLMTPGSQTAVRFVVEDAGGEDLVEGGLDDLTLTGISLDCQSWSIPTPDPPGAVGDTLRVERYLGSHLRLTWQPPSASGGTDPELGYRVTRSPDPQGPFDEIGRPVETTFVDVDAAASVDPAFDAYLVDSIQPGTP